MTAETNGPSAPVADPWPAPTANGPLDAVIALPGSKSLTARALVLAAVAAAPTELSGVLRSRDTDLMVAALTTLGARFERLDDAGTRQRVTPAPLPLPVTAGPDGEVRVDCGLAGTVMRFVPPLAALATAPVTFDGDDGARLRPLGPVLDALAALGAEVTWLGEPGHLPVHVGPGQGRLLAPASEPQRVTVDASGSSQFLSALLLAAPLVPGGLALTPTGHVPSLPHVAMTAASLRERGVVVDEPAPEAPEGGRTWTVHPGRPAGGAVAIEPDLSNAGPFLAAALVAGGSVTVPDWPASTTQAGDAWRDLLPRLGGRVTVAQADDGGLALTASGDGAACLTGIDADLSAVGELAPTVAALAALASANGRASRLTGIAHLRGHETNRLAALVTEIQRVGGAARETADGIEVDALPAGAALRPAVLETYADHRMATFASLLGLGIPGCEVVDVACTSKTLPDFPVMWSTLLTPRSGHPDREIGTSSPRDRDVPSRVQNEEAR
ncbi:3-phosphoshikimate 1-carboxyvinyltransferase [Actinomyces radicidentis]|uniref:3-phosphoshikimate 1-carboxyvinyltransferase n=1 Tax=Actinomyces radicidentis TaxID=111015 RepID=A0A0X8JGE5_ACTRD|nr:3-phosphoshikimate 1-carboxyvinyltransferase [Actinomyces radicidentis]AMD88350.1 3-phosphoshikimate 1-carboxyvinyltransferase [Actinomyces radicidentis]